MVDFMVRMFRLMGLPKTIGSIYGYVYASPEPVSMDDLTQALGISLGSASQGLRTLKVFRAIKPVYAQGNGGNISRRRRIFSNLWEGF